MFHASVGRFWNSETVSRHSFTEVGELAVGIHSEVDIVPTGGEVRRATDRDQATIWNW